MNPTFSADGDYVAFQWDKPEIERSDIYVKAVGEAHASQITTDPAGSFSPAWSPDNRHIAFSRSGTGEQSGIYLISPLSREEKKRSDFPSGGQISWTPDGKFVAVGRERIPDLKGGSPSGIFLVPVKGGKEVQITFPLPPTPDDTPSVSPDGTLLLSDSRLTALFPFPRQ